MQIPDGIPVQIGGRLIEQDDFRKQGGDRTAGDFLLLATG